MTKFNKEMFTVDFGMYGMKEMEGYGTDVFFIYKTKSNWTVCHKQSNLKLSNLSHRLLKTAKDRVARVESAFDWSGIDGLEIAQSNNMTGREFSQALSEALDR